MRLRRAFTGLPTLSVAWLALATPLAFAQSDVECLMAQGLAQDASLDTTRALQTFLEAGKLAPSDANVL